MNRKEQIDTLSLASQAISYADTNDSHERTYQLAQAQHAIHKILDVLEAEYTEHKKEFDQMMAYLIEGEKEWQARMTGKNTPKKQM